MSLNLEKRSRLLSPIRIPVIMIVVACNLVVNSLGGTLAAQKDDDRRAIKEREHKALKLREHKALKLLDELLANSEELTSSEDRLFLMIEAVGLLWSSDETHARKITERVKDELFKAKDQLRQKNAQDLLKGIGEGENSHAVDEKNESLLALRNQVLVSLAAKDPDLTLSFLKSTQPFFSDVKDIARRDEIHLETSLTPLFAAKKPELAYRLTQTILSKEPDGWIWTLDTWKNLRKAAPHLSVKLLNDMVVKLKSTHPAGKQYPKSDSLNNSFVMHLAVAIRGARLESDQAKKQKADESAPVLTNYSEEQESYREILKIIVSRALNLTQKELAALEKSYELESLISNMEYLSPDIKELLPSQGARMPRKLEQMERSLDGFTRELREEFRKNDIPQEESAKEDSATLSSEGIEEFRNDFQKQMLIISSLPSEEEQAARFADLANQTITFKIWKEAREALEQAIAASNSKMSTGRQVWTQIAIAKACVTLDPNRAFEIIAAVMKRIDRIYLGVKEYIVFMTGGDNRAMSDQFLMLLTGIAMEIGPVMQKLAAEDFDQAAEVIKQGQMNYLRLSVSVSLIEGVLGNTKRT